MMKRYCSWIIFLSFIFQYNGYGQDSTKYLTIKQCVDLAIKNNLQVQQSQIQLEQNGVLYKQSKDNLLPQINGTIQQQFNYGRSISNLNNSYVDVQNSAGNYALNANLLLFNGFSYQNAIKQNALNYDASKMDLQQQKDNITLNVILNYLTVLSNQEALDIARSQASVDSAQVARLEIQNQEGAIPPATLYDLKGQYASDLVIVVNAVNALEVSKINLFSVLNVPYQKDATYEMVTMNADISDLRTSSDSIFQTALQIIPNIKATDLRVQSFQKSIAAARGRYYPSLSIYGSLSSNFTSIATTDIPGTGVPFSTGQYVNVGGSSYDVMGTSFSTQKTSFGDQVKNNRFQAFGLQLNIPILNYLSVRNNVKTAKLNYENAKVLSNASRNQLQQLVEQAWQNLRSAYGQYKGYLDQVHAYGESFRTAEIRFNAGVITSVDYVIAKNNYDRANTNLSAARYNYIFRTKILEYYQGRLTLN
ncbi:MAG TPA: TolC family protein [Puia sp.]|nr:TolC family protein [Puia sp.]